MTTQSIQNSINQSPWRFSLILIPLVLAGVAFSPRAQAESPCPDPCPDHPHPFTQPDASICNAVTVPPSYDGDIFRPKDTQAYPGKRPAIVLMHGRGGTKCALYWAARLLAAHGYVTLTLSVPNDKDPVPPHILATERAIDYLRSTANPFAAYIDGDNIGLAGHSLGATAVCYVQGVSPYVQAIVALDNLKEFRHGDPGGAHDCDEDMTDPNTPRVPALGMANDDTANDDDCSHPAKTNKQYGWSAWRAAQVASMELVMQGFKHADFGNGSSDQKLPEGRLLHARLVQPLPPERHVAGRHAAQLTPAWQTDRLHAVQDADAPEPAERRIPLGGVHPGQDPTAATSCPASSTRAHRPRSAKLRRKWSFIIHKAADLKQAAAIRNQPSRFNRVAAFYLAKFHLFRVSSGQISGCTSVMSEHA